MSKNGRGWDEIVENKRRRRLWMGRKAFLLALGFVFILCSVSYVQAKDKIVIGAARSLSGPLATIGDSAFRPVYEIWVEKVNKAGGIYVKEYGKKLPVELKIYDDKSDMATMTRLLEKVIVDDKVDLLFPPVSTGFLFAAAPIANKHKKLLVGCEGGATKLKELIPRLPYVFASLNFSDHNQVPVLVDLLADAGAKSAAIIFMGDLHGIEYSSVEAPLLTTKGIDVKFMKSVPPGIKDLSPLLREAKRLKVDVLIVNGYPDEVILTTKQLMEIDFNPKALVLGPGGNFGFYKKIFGPAAEGVIGFGAWNCKTPGMKEFCDVFFSKYGEDRTDWWGHFFYWAWLQFLEKAIEKTGSIDNDKLREVFAEEKLDTSVGKIWFDEHHLMAKECHPGEIGQWQKGMFEVVGPKDKATAKFIYPKPPWPKK